MKPVSEETITRITKRLASQNVGAWRNLDFEIQDDSKFLLVSATVGATNDPVELKRVCELIAAAVKTEVPDREDDYSWMVVLKTDGKVVESSFGGRKP